MTYQIFNIINVITLNFIKYKNKTSHDNVCLITIR